MLCILQLLPQEGGPLKPTGSGMCTIACICNTQSDSIQFAYSFSHIRGTFLWKVHKSSGHALHYIKDLTHWLLLRTQDLIYSGALISVLLQWVAPYAQPIPPSRTFYRCRKCHYCIPPSEYTAQLCPSPE